MVTVGVELGLRAGAHSPMFVVTERESPARSIRQWGAPVFTERTSVGLDVHARSVAAAAIDGVTGEVFQTRLTRPTSTSDRGSPAAGSWRWPMKPGQPVSGLSRVDHGRDSCGVAFAVEAAETIRGPGPESDAGMRCICRGCFAWTRSRRCRSPGVRKRLVIWCGPVTVAISDESAPSPLQAAAAPRHRVLRGKAWTGAHDRWLRTEAAPQLTVPATRMAFDADYDHVLTMQARRGAWSGDRGHRQGPRVHPVVRRVSCLRGVSTLTGLALAVEIGDWHRFTGNTIGSFIGLVPSEYSSGSSRAQGPITKTGMTACSPVAGRGGWDHRPRYWLGAVMGSRWDQAPPAARAGGRGQPPPARQVGGVPGTAQAVEGGQCGDRRAGRLVLVPGGLAGLIAT